MYNQRVFFPILEIKTFRQHTATRRKVSQMPHTLVSDFEFGAAVLRLVPGSGWASMGSAGSTPRRFCGPQPHTPKPRNPVAPIVPQTTPPGPITLIELREFAGNGRIQHQCRVAIMVVGMWLAAQPQEHRASAQQRAGTLAAKVRNGERNATQLASTLFPKDAADLVLAKADAIVRILRARLAPMVCDLAANHVSSRCNLTAAHVVFAAKYVAQIREEQPSLNQFTGDGLRWSPNFP